MHRALGSGSLDGAGDRVRAAVASAEAAADAAGRPLARHAAPDAVREQWRLVDAHNLAGAQAAARRLARIGQADPASLAAAEQAERAVALGQAWWQTLTDGGRHAGERAGGQAAGPGSCYGHVAGAGAGLGLGELPGADEAALRSRAVQYASDLAQRLAAAHSDHGGGPPPGGAGPPGTARHRAGGAARRRRQPERLAGAGATLAAGGWQQGRRVPVRGDQPPEPGLDPEGRPILCPERANPGAEAGRPGRASTTCAFSRAAMRSQPGPPSAGSASAACGTGRRGPAMFEQFYGFRKTPFTKDVPSSELFPSEQHKELLARLQYMVQQRWFGLVSGEIGAGKSTAIRALHAMLNSSRRRFLYVSQSGLVQRSPGLSAGDSRRGRGQRTLGSSASTEPRPFSRG